jgi:hypothetical protein
VTRTEGNHFVLVSPVVEGINSFLASPVIEYDLFLYQVRFTSVAHNMVYIFSVVLGQNQIQTNVHAWVYI